MALRAGAWSFTANALIIIRISKMEIPIRTKTILGSVIWSRFETRLTKFLRDFQRVFRTGTIKTTILRTISILEFTPKTWYVLTTLDDPLEPQA